MTLIAKTKDAYQLLQDGANVLSIMEHNGVRIDMKFLRETQERNEKTVKRKTEKLLKSNVWKKWKRKFPGNAKLTNRFQLGAVLSDMGHEFDRTEPTARFPEGQLKVDEEGLEKVDHPFVKMYLQTEKIKKLGSTWLRNLERETVDGFLHPSFHLHTARSFRSSSGRDKDVELTEQAEINFQNLPVRNPERAEMIRRCFIPRRDDWSIFEIDYGGIEVSIAYCYHKDEKLKKDHLEGDMHRDMAAECFMLPTDKVNKMSRYCSKNMFVFPQFYGSYYIDCARNMWKSMDRLKLVVGDPENPDCTVREHLAKKGIKALGECDPSKDAVKGTFEYHMKEIERKFWEVRYKTYDKWKKDYWRKYLEKGYCQMYTGFLVKGPHRKNDVVNYPIQGAAFHCLLKSAILIQKELIKRRMKTRLFGQIHDSIVADGPKKETKDYISIANEVMLERIPKLWKWITIPLRAEAEVTPPGMSWFYKKGYELK